MADSPNPTPAKRYRFGVFEADAVTGELRRQGVRVRLHAQPFQVLLLLLERPGELLTREEICRELWPGDTFVDYDHGLNSAINRLREALGDKAANPRFLETLARRGYRFVAPVERISDEPAAADEPEAIAIDDIFLSTVLATPEDLPRSSPRVVQTLFLLLQLMYIGFYVGALANLPEINELVSAVPHAPTVFAVIIITASVLIPVRLFLACSAMFYAPGWRARYLKLWLVLLPFDLFWAVSPFLLLHHINFGLALALSTPLFYSPFAQRGLVLMGAGQRAKV